MPKNDRSDKAESGFFSRWSERKRGDAEEEPAAPTPAEVGPETAEAGEESWSEGQVQEKLAEIDTMKEGDDFKPLLAAGVPEIVKRAALRKLWRSNPVFGILDGLNDYDLDYTIKPGTAEQLRSAYQAGKGYVYDEEAEAERQAEIAERQRRDKEKARLRAEEKTRAEAEGETKPDGQTGDDAEVERSPEAGRNDPKAVPESETERDENRKPRGSAAARRWGGSLS